MKNSNSQEQLWARKEKAIEITQFIIGLGAFLSGQKAQDIQMAAQTGGTAMRFDPMTTVETSVTWSMLLQEREALFGVLGDKLESTRQHYDQPKNHINGLDLFYRSPDVYGRNRRDRKSREIVSCWKNANI